MTPLETVESLFGRDAFLVPCEWGTKKPLVTYVERPFESTKTTAYRALFEVQEVNVAVYLGKASGGLCAIDFDRDEDLAAFLAVNPGLARTTRSRGSRGGMIWIRIKAAKNGERRMENEACPEPSPPDEEREAGGSGLGDYPPSCNATHFEWRADNRLSTICGRHPKGMDYTLVVDASPVAVDFTDI